MADTTRRITGWSVLSTNGSRTVLDDTTRMNLVSIIDNIMTVSKVAELSRILIDITNHMKGYGVTDPHATDINKLPDSVFDKLYQTWLERGNSGSKDDLRAVIFKYSRVCNVLDVFNAVDDNNPVSVLEFMTFLMQYHNDAVIDYDKFGFFRMSEKQVGWPGKVSGTMIKQGGILQIVDDSTPSIYPESNNLPEYYWNILITRKFYHAFISVDVETNTHVKVFYKYSTESAWSLLPDSVKVDIYKRVNTDGTITDLTDAQVYRYRLSVDVNHLLLIKDGFEVPDAKSLDFKLELDYDKLGSTDIPKDAYINNITTQIDGRGAITDDPNQKEMYKEISHASLLEPFISTGTTFVPAPIYSWIDAIYTQPLTIHDVSDIEGTFRIVGQIHTTKLTQANDKPTVSTTKTVKLLSLQDASGVEVFSISGLTTGLYLEEDTTKLTRLDSVLFHIDSLGGTKIITPNFLSSNRAVYSIVVTYNKSLNTCSVWYHDEQGISSYSVPFFLSPALSTITKVVPTLKDVLNNNFIGLHQFGYYNSRLEDIGYLKLLTLVDITKLPFIKPKEQL